MFYRFWFSKEEEVNKVMAIKKGFTKLFFSFFSILFSTSIFLSEANAAEDVNRYIFVPNRASADIAVIDTVTDELIRRIEVGSVPHQVVVSDKLDKLAVTNSADNTLSIIDLNTFLVVSTVELGEEPEHIAINPSGDVIAVGNIGGGSISFVSLNKGSELKRVSGLYEPHNMTFNSDGSHLSLPPFDYLGNSRPLVVPCCRFWFSFRHCFLSDFAQMFLCLLRVSCFLQKLRGYHANA